MKKIINGIYKSSVLGSLFLVMLGLLLIFQSEATILTISYVIAGVLIAIGVLALLKFVRQVKNNQDSGMEPVYGIISIVLGIVVICNPQAIASIIPIVMGLLIIINSGTKLQYSMELKKNNNNLWKSTMILSLVTTICGVVLLFNPFKGAVFITKVIGSLILIYAVLDIISTITIKNTVKKIKNAKEEVKEAQIIETEDNPTIELPEKKKSKTKDDDEKKGEE